ncbi:extracellular solute-binding protein [Celeribacter neptunius]|uniref:Putative spermidine/putrescine transport system substrate-binding protein n=1 Tax=Celeribacter neptunius TaxID=588602 RepID=A0A1I3TC11_9RHOB|nr:extracellular solute-binding protein [Celeribacter neptunius]SFJ67919.1 putative spermidine/putrescine transport system substrate-binding protein [Celeribacter neptunius]
MRKMTSAAFAALLMTASAHAADTVTIVDWGGDFQAGLKASVYDPFAEEFGVDVVLDTWQGGYGNLRARLESGVSGWDIIEVEAEEQALGCADGLLAEIDWEGLGVAGDFIPEAVKDCGVGSILWSIGLGWNGDNVSEAPDSWADFFDLETFPGKRSLRRGPKYALEIALLGDGVPADEIYDVLATDEGVDRAFAKLDTIKDELIFWEGGTQPIQTLASGDTVLSAIYSPDFLKSRQDGINLGLMWDESFYQFDYWVVAATAPQDVAQEFLSVWARPEVQANFVASQDYGPANSKALDLVDAERAKDLPSAVENIENAIATDTEFWVDHVEMLTERFEQWASQ